MEFRYFRFIVLSCHSFHRLLTFRFINAYMFGVSFSEEQLYFPRITKVDIGKGGNNNMNAYTVTCSTQKFRKQNM